MSIPVLNNLDLNKNQLLNVLFQIIAGNHGSPVEGMFWYDSSAQVIKYRDADSNETVISLTALTAALADYQLESEKGSANGYASLDGSGKVPAAQLGATVMEYQGTWNASTNSPALADGTGSTGDVYRVSTAGTRDLGSGNITFDVGDLVIYNGSVWQKSDTTDAVASVAGKTGVVTLVKGDVGLGNVDNTSDANKPVSTAQQAALDALTAAIAAHLADTTDAHDASAISYAPTGSIAATNVQDAIAEAASEASGTTGYAGTITGDGSDISFDVPHMLGTLDIICQVWKVSNGKEVFVEKSKPDDDTVRIDFGAYVPANTEAFRVVVMAL